MATLLEKANQILNEKNEKVLPENIKKDITIYGVTGTLETSGAKVFSTQEEMQADTTAQEGDLAVVYRSETQNATVDSKFQVATFPETVVLDTALTDRVEVRYRAADSSKMFDCMGSLNRSRFSMNCYTESGSIDIEYTSTDGITYTRTDTTGNPVDFGTEIYYAYTEMWNDVIGKFIQIDGSTFEGLFKNTLVTVGYGVTGYSNITSDNSTITATEEVKSITNWLDKINSLVGDTSNTVKEVSIIILDNVPYLYDYNMDVWLLDNTHMKLQNMITNSTDDMVLKSLISDDTLTLPVDTNYYRIYNDSKWYFTQQTFDTIPFICNVLIYQGIPYYNVQGRVAQTYLRKSTNKTNGMENISYLSNNVIDETALRYIYAPTQLSVTPEYVYEKEFYGKNGLETGTLTNVENLTLSEVVTKTEIFSLLSDIVCPASMYYAFKESQLEHIDISNLDFSNTTNMGFMFYGCSNLKSVNFGTMELSNVTNIDCLFGRCTSLETIDLTPLTGCSPTNGYGLFSDCTLLKRIDLSPIDLSKLTSITHMLMNCVNLEFADLSSIDFGGKNPSREFFMDNVPDTCEILVKDQASKNWFSTYMSRFTNVKIKS